MFCHKIIKRLHFEKKVDMCPKLAIFGIFEIIDEIIMQNHKLNWANEFKFCNSCVFLVIHAYGAFNLQFNTKSKTRAKCAKM